MEQPKKFIIEDSDDEELPDLFINDCEADSENTNEIVQGDIVWAEFRKLYWPSLVRCVYKKEKKVSIWYLDSPKKTFKVALKKIKTFCDPKVNTIIREEVQGSPMKALHTKVWLNALTYIRRQAEGQNDDPALYFDLNQHYFASKDCKMHISRCDVASTENSVTLESIPEDTDEESLVSSEDEDGAGLEKKISIFWDLDDSLEDDAKTTAIVDCITSGKVDKHLLRIKKRRTPSIYQQTFDDAMKTDRKKLFGISACDIIKNLKKLKDISFYLMNLYEKTVERGKCEMLDYVTSVWLPEAINHAVLLLEGGVPVEADPPEKKKLFSKTESVKEEKSDKTDQTTTILIQTNNENETNGKRSLRKRQPRNENFYSESKDVSPAKSPRKKYKKRVKK